MIIGFAGKAATGKTTAARHLAATLEMPVTILPMAKVLRDEVEAFLRGIDAQEFVPLVYGDQDDKVRVFHVDTAKAQAACPIWEGFVTEHREIQDHHDRTAVTVRRILQWWGTEYRRAQDPDYWTKAWGREVETLAFEKRLILVDDVRFMNELNVIRDHGGLIVKIERPGFDGANNHSSETSLDGYSAWDGKIVNDDTIDQLGINAETLIAELLQKAAVSTSP